MRVRYWRLSITDVLHATYPAEKANHWDIKCMQGEYEHFGVFWYRYGTPFDKEPIHGICFYHNDIPQKTVQDLIAFLQEKFGGKVLYRQARVFLQGSKEFADGKSVGLLQVFIDAGFEVEASPTPRRRVVRHRLGATS